MNNPADLDIIIPWVIFLILYGSFIIYYFLIKIYKLIKLCYNILCRVLKMMVRKSNVMRCAFLHNFMLNVKNCVIILLEGENK